MKIALLSPNFPSQGNPIFVFVQQLVFALVDKGIEVVVIAPQSLTHLIVRGGKLLHRVNVEKTKNGNFFMVYRPYEFSYGNCLGQLNRLTNWVFNYQLNTILDEIKPDVLYGHFWYIAYRLKDYALKHNLPLFVACGEGDNALEHLAETLSPKNKDLLVKAVKGVISVSFENKRKCIEFGLAKEEDIVVLPNCVDESLFHPADGRELRRSLGVADDDFLILFVGGFISRKGANRLSEAIDKLADPKIKSVFIGRPMGGDSVLPSCKDIVFQGPIEHDILPNYYNAADVFVLPTQKEGCCNAIVESLACGTPVISANRSFNVDILNDKNSVLVDPDNVDEIANAIAVLRDDKELLAEKKQNTKSQAGNYSIKDRADKIVAFINKKTNNVLLKTNSLLI